MRIILYLFIATAFFARAGLLFFYYRTKYHRQDDLYVGIGLVILGLSYGMYSVTLVTPRFDIYEVILDVILGILAVVTTVKAYLQVLKESSK